ncbi:ankyrin repeat domain-containing protein [Saccharophagus degradans]|uniref:Ankyrin repeat domain-containing protein n=1 Tax=Saccharophagus degradans TaxID=86304 RepID=A0AAW7X9X7_9GAMM|nr:ankyrin repeat domain-containing protein [Saccharophagus degradans]MDO6423667.1 ankyrin repeat domain-containing protein [Saccharophagus degradans]MDO6607662.1 ankyrin repeat domain-containing protein [Saccharophagus degradans]
MSVYSECVSTNVTILKNNLTKALDAVKHSPSVTDIFSHLDIKSCTHLEGVLELFEMSFDANRKGLTNIGYSRGDDDNSIHLWPVLAPFVEEGCELIMEHDGERETVRFSNGGFSITPDDEEEYFEEDGCSVENEHEENCEEGLGYDRAKQAPNLEDLLDQLLEDFVKGDLDSSSMKRRIIENKIAVRTDNEGCTALLLILKWISDANGEKFLSLYPKIKEIVYVLLESGVNVNQQSEDGETALYYALAGERWDIVEELVARGAILVNCKEYNLIELVAKKASIKVLDFIRAKLGVFKRNQTRCLVLACGNDRNGSDTQQRAEFVRYFIEDLGLKVNSVVKTSVRVHDIACKNITPLIAAAVAGNYYVAEYLIGAGADVNMKDASGNLALHYCAGPVSDRDSRSRLRSNNLELVKLIATKQCINLKNNQGKSPYMLALKINKPAIDHFNSLLAVAGVNLPTEINDEFSGCVKLTPREGLAYSVNYVSGKLHGEQLFFHSENNPFVAISYENGNPHGEYRVWHRSGAILLQSQFLKGKPVGEAAFYSEEGQLIKKLNFDEAGELHGRQLIMNGANEMAVDATYRHGYLHGKVFFKNTKEEKVLIDDEYAYNFPSSVPIDIEALKEGRVSGATLGAARTDLLFVVTMKGLLNFGDTLFFHKPAKLSAFIKKTQLESIH